MDFSSPCAKNCKPASPKTLGLTLGLFFGIPIGLFLLYVIGVCFYECCHKWKKRAKEWKTNRREREKGGQRRWWRYYRDEDMKKRWGRARECAMHVDVEKGVTENKDTDEKEGSIGSAKTLTDNSSLWTRIRGLVTRPFHCFPRVSLSHKKEVDVEKGEAPSTATSESEGDKFDEKDAVPKTSKDFPHTGQF